MVRAVRVIAVSAPSGRVGRRTAGDATTEVGRGRHARTNEAGGGDQAWGAVTGQPARRRFRGVGNAISIRISGSPVRSRTDTPAARSESPEPRPTRPRQPRP